MLCCDELILPVVHFGESNPFMHSEHLSFAEKLHSSTWVGRSWVQIPEPASNFSILSQLKWYCSIILQLNLYANFAKVVKCIKCLAFLCRRNISNLSKNLMIKNWLQQCYSLEIPHSKQILMASLIFDLISKQFINLWAEKNEGRGRKWGGSFYFVFVTRGRKMIGMITTFKWIDGHWPLRTFEQTHW